MYVGLTAHEQQLLAEIRLRKEQILREIQVGKFNIIIICSRCITNMVFRHWVKK